MAGFISLLVAFYVLVGVGLAALAWVGRSSKSEIALLLVAWPVVALLAERSR